MYYRLVVENGHVGAGKSIDTVRYFMAENPVDLFSNAARIPRAKGKANASGVKLIERVTRDQYEQGLALTQNNVYLARRKRKKKGKKKKETLFH